MSTQAIHFAKATSTMRVAVINTLYHPEQVGGAELTVKSIAEGMVKQGIETLVISLSRQKDRPTQDSINGVATQTISIPNIYWPFPHSNRSLPKKILWHTLDIYNPFSRRRLSKLLRAFSPDLIQTHNLTGFSVAAWGTISRVNVPLLHVLHDYSLLCPKVSMMRNDTSCDGRCTVCRFARAPKRIASEKVTGVVGVSDFVLRSHIDARFFSNASERSVIHNSYAVPAADKSAATERENEGTLRLGFVGSIVPHKGLEVLLRAVSRFPTKSVTLKIGGIGGDSYVGDLRRKYFNPNVRFLGKVKVEEFFAEIDVLVVPSIWNEPFGRVVIEAYAHGVPVIGTRVGGITEIISNGETGWLVPPNDVDALAASIGHVIEKRTILRDLTESALRKARNFDPSTATAKFIEIQERLIRGIRKGLKT